MLKFKQVDVFTAQPYRGNPVAVVFDAEVTDAEMQRFAHWTNLSETTFLLPPTNSEADYRVRIFTTDVELPFAGHPTIGTCHAWLEAGGKPKDSSMIVQECGAGLVRLRRDQDRLAFAAPPLIRSGSVEPALVARICTVLGVETADVVSSAWIDNGPGWVGVQLADAAAVKELNPSFGDERNLMIGVVGAYPKGAECAIEVRAFFRADGAGAEDPVTGSLNASLAQWLIPAGVLSAPYTASQGSSLGRLGRVFVEEADGDIWVGGQSTTCIDGEVAL